MKNLYDSAHTEYCEKYKINAENIQKLSSINDGLKSISWQTFLKEYNSFFQMEPALSILNDFVIGNSISSRKENGEATIGDMIERFISEPSESTLKRTYFYNNSKGNIERALREVLRERSVFYSNFRFFTHKKNKSDFIKITEKYFTDSNIIPEYCLCPFCKTLLNDIQSEFSKSAVANLDCMGKDSYCPNCDWDDDDWDDDDW